jgi:hypothetical protein
MYRFMYEQFARSVNAAMSYKGCRIAAISDTLNNRRDKMLSLSNSLVVRSHFFS